MARWSGPVRSGPFEATRQNLATYGTPGDLPRVSTRSSTAVNYDLVRISWFHEWIWRRCGRLGGESLPKCSPHPARCRIHPLARIHEL